MANFADGELLENRILVELDDGETNVGVMIAHNLRSYRRLMTPGTNPPPPEEPTEDVYHTHIVFIESMTTEVTIGGNTYLAMHKNAIVGYITD